MHGNSASAPTMHYAEFDQWKEVSNRNDLDDKCQLSG